jgi:hypothetical protein
VRPNNVNMLKSLSRIAYYRYSEEPLIDSLPKRTASEYASASCGPLDKCLEINNVTGRQVPTSVQNGTALFKSEQLALLPEPANTIRDWQANNDHVHQQALDQVVKREWPSCVKGGERQNNQTHHEFDSNTEEQTAD